MGESAPPPGLGRCRPIPRRGWRNGGKGATRREKRPGRSVVQPIWTITSSGPTLICALYVGPPLPKPWAK